MNFQKSECREFFLTLQVLFAGETYVNGESQLLAYFVAQSLQMGRVVKSRRA
jgi:hypothetical protein